MKLKTEQEVREKIKETTHSYWHVLDCWPATVLINSPRALMQLSAKAELDALYWVLGEERPRYRCDDTTKTDH